MYVVAYDITAPKRLRQVAKTLNRYGLRVQKSVYECDIDETQYRELRALLAALMEEGDSIIGYRLRGGGATPVGDSLRPAAGEPRGRRRRTRGRRPGGRRASA